MIGLGLTGVCVPLQTSGPDRAIRSLFSSGEQGAWYDPSGNAEYFVARQQSYAALPGVSGAYFSTPDSTTNSITGDIDIRVKVALDDWTPATTQALLAKDDASAQRAYLLYISSAAPTRLRFNTPTDGTSNNIAESSVDHGISDGSTKWVRVVRVASTGSVTFYLSDDGSTWTQLGAVVSNTAGSMLNVTAANTVGAYGSAGGLGYISGKIYRAQIYNGINGTLAVDFNPAQWATGTTWTSSTGEVWTQNGTASIGGVTGTPLLFQDAAGTTPVTAVEQPVGLMLDKSKGLVLGSELVTNGTFDTNINGWTAQAGLSSATRDTSIFTTGGLRIVANGSGNSYVTQTISGLTVGRQYVISTSAYTPSTNTTNNRATIGIQATGFNAAGSIAQLSTDTIQTLTIRFFATSTTQTIYCSVVTADFISWGAPGAAAYFDNISVRELPGNHAYQSGATTLRPTLSARYNLLTYTEQFDNAAWNTQRVAVTPYAAVAPDGTTTAAFMRPTSSANADEAWRTVTTQTGVLYEMSICAKAAGKNFLALGNSDSLSNVVFFNLSTGAVGTVASGFSGTIVSLGNGWYRCIARLSALGTTTQYTAMVTDADGAIYASASATDGIYIWGASLVPADQASLPYQRVAAATDYDTSPVFKPYIYFDGTDDSWVTNSIDFSGTDKMTVLAGVRKLGNTGAAGIIQELSTTGDTTNGCFLLYAEPTSKYGMNSLGTVRALAQSANDYVAPITNVVTGQSNISGDSIVLRVNGTQAATSTSDQGTGNFGNYPLYIGRRGGTSLPFKGNLYSLVIRGAASSDAQVQAAESYVNGKTGAWS